MEYFTKKQVIFFSQTSGYGGCENHFIQIIKSLPSQQVTKKVVFAIPSSSPYESVFTKILEDLKTSNIIEEFEFIKYPKGLLNLKALINIVQSLTTTKTIIHFYRGSLDSCLVPLLVSFLMRKKSVQTLQNRLLPPSSKNFSIRNLFYSVSLNISDYIIAVSESIRQQCIDLYNVSPDKIITIRNGVRIEDFSKISKPREEKLKEISAELNLDLKNKNILLCVARLDKQKGHKYLIEALSIIKNNHPNIAKNLLVLLAGEGSLKDAITEQIKSNQLDLIVKLLGLRYDVNELLISCDAMILTSLFEGLPLSIVEAMCLGKPVLATAVDGVPEIVIDSKTGILMESKNPLSIANSIINFLQLNEEEKMQMGLRGKKRALEEFDLKLNNDKIMEIYSKLID